MLRLEAFSEDPRNSEGPAVPVVSRKRPLSVPVDENTTQLIKKARTLEYDCVWALDREDFDVKTAIDNIKDSHIESIFAFARRSLVERRDIFWGPNCTFCKKPLDSETPLILCTSCRQFRYCSIDCCNRNMGHSFNGCTAKPQFRVSDQHRIRHVLTGDAKALEQTLKPGSVGMSFTEKNPSIFVAHNGGALPLLELASRTGDVNVVVTLMRLTRQGPFCIVGRRPLFAESAMIRDNFGALCAMFLPSYDDPRKLESTVAQLSKVKELKQAPAENGARILACVLDAQRRFDFAGARPMKQEEKLKPKEHPFWEQQARICSLFFSLVGSDMPYDSPASHYRGSFVADALSQFIRQFESYARTKEAGLTRLVKSDRTRRKEFSSGLLAAVTKHTSPEFLEMCLTNGFNLMGAVDLWMPHSVRSVECLPIITKHFPDGQEWTTQIDNPRQALKQGRHPDSALTRAWNHYLRYENETHEVVEWMAAHGGEINLKAIIAEDLDASIVVSPVAIPGGLFQPAEPVIRGLRALSVGFNSYLLAAQEILLETLSMLPKDLIVYVICTLLSQNDWIDDVNLRITSIECRAAEHNREPPMIFFGFPGRNPAPPLF